MGNGGRLALPTPQKQNAFSLSGVTAYDGWCASVSKGAWLEWTPHLPGL